MTDPPPTTTGDASTDRSDAGAGDGGGVIDLILGTAGHIDHGKTSLVRLLTNVDTDRLPEEKKRGITIELGFAELLLDGFRLGIVDVPGHEKFVRNMLAGATGMDLALLVVAADDSVKPQTREHLEILKLLDLKAGVIALTKCDLSDPDWIDLVEDEVRDLVDGTFLAEAPIVRCSSHTAEGIDLLRDALRTVAAQVGQHARRRQRSGPLRLAIDRTFTIAGHGTVVTGSVSSGQASVGDELVIEPSGVKVRVRGIQQHDRAVDSVHRGQRAAINLAGVHHHQLGRGQELATPGHLVESRLLTVQLKLLPSAPRPLKNRTRARMHVGTAEVMASVVLFEGDPLSQGQSAIAQLFLQQSVVTTWNQPFVLRSESPVVTIGGGRVLDPQASKVRRSATAKIASAGQLSSADPLLRASAALYLRGTESWQPIDLVRMAGIEQPQQTLDALAEQQQLIEMQVSPTRTAWIHQRTIDDISARIEATLNKLHDQFPLNSMLDRARLLSRLDYVGSQSLLDAILQRLASAKRIKIGDRGVALAGRGPQLSKAEQKLVDRLIEQYRSAGLRPATVAELKKQAVKNQAVVPQLIDLATAEGHLIKISDEFRLHREVEAELRDRLSKEMAGGSGLTLSQIRELLETSRKYAVPFCEYLDHVGFTRRDGDLRYLV